MNGHNYAHTENFMGSNGATSSSGSSAGIIQAVGEASSAIVQALGTIQDAKQRRQFEERLAIMSSQEQRALNEKLLKAQSDNEKRRILAENLSATNVARIQALNKESKNIILWVIGGIILIGSAYIVYKKSKKK